MELKIIQIGNSLGVRIPKAIIGERKKGDSIEVFFEVPEKNADIPEPSGEVPMDKTEKIEALRNLISMTEKKHEPTFEEIGPKEEEADEIVLYDDTKDIPDEYKLKPGYGPKKF